MSDLKVYQVFSTPLSEGAITFGRSDTYTDTVNCNPSQLFWDNNNHYLGIGTGSPAATLDVRGTVVFNDGGLSTADVRMEGDTDGNLFFLDASADQIGIGTASPGAKLDVRGSVIVNEDAGNNDVRMESQSQTHLFFLDASAGKIGINDSTPSRLLDVNGDLACTTIFGTSTTFIAGDTLYCGGGTGADNFFFDRDYAGGQFIIGYNTPRKVGATGAGIFQIYDNSTTRTILLQCKSSGSTGGQKEVSINDAQADVDFRWETDANDYGIMGDAGNANVTINGASVSAHYDLGLVGDGILMTKETATPTADTNYGKWYCKNDDKAYFQDGAGSEHELAYAASVITDHGGLGGLTDDDHSIYALLAGRSGGQTLIGSTLTAEDLTLQDNAVDGNTITVTQAIAAYTHVSNNGSDHSYIDQDVTSGANVTFGTIGCGTITSTGDLIVRDLGYLGSASDPDAIQIEADGDVVFTQDIIVNGGVLYTDTIGEDDSGQGVTIDGVLIKDTRIQEIDAIHRSVNDDHLTIAGGDGITSGCSLDLYGGAHAIAASDFSFKVGGVERFGYDESNTLFTFGQSIHVDGDITSDGGTIYTDTISEDDAGQGVTIDENVIKDGDIYNTVDDENSLLSGGNSPTSGSNILLYGGTHVTAAGDFVIRVGSTNRLWFDSSANLWTFTDGDTVEIDVLNEATASAGVTIEGVLLKDNDIVIPDGATIGSVSDPDVMTIDASGNTTFSVFPITPSAAPDADYEVANKKYVDDNIGGGSGSMTTVKEGGVQLGGADIVTLDFNGDDFNLTEDPDTEVNITINDAGIDHDATTNFVANEHIDWTSASDNFDTSGSISVDTINEHTAGTGVTIEGVLFKDSRPTYNDMAMNFIRASSQYLYMADSASTSITGDLSIECWIWLRQLPSVAGGSYTLVSKYETTRDDRSYRWDIVSTNDKMRFYASDDGTSAGTHFVIWEASTALIDVGRWYHLAVTFDISTETCKFYIDGNEENGSVVAGTTIGATIDDNASQFCIGNFEGGTSYCDMLIDETRLWNDICTQSEIQDNMKRQLVPANEANLVGYWRFENDILDETTNNNDLTNSGSAYYAGDTPFSFG